MNDIIQPIIVWSNFEIADLDFWRSEAYMKFFDYLEAKGGFYYEVRTQPNHIISTNALILFFNFIFSALGRRTRPFHRSRTVQVQRPNPLLPRYRLQTPSVHSLSP